MRGWPVTGNARPASTSNSVSLQWRRVMETKSRSLARARLAGSCILAAVLSQAAYAGAVADSASSVQAVWQPVEIKYSYVGFTTAYNCDAFESKVKTILLALGATPLTKVQANGCIDVNRPS